MSSSEGGGKEKRKEKKIQDLSDETVDWVCAETSQMPQKKKDELHADKDNLTKYFL